MQKTPMNHHSEQKKSRIKEYKFKNKRIKERKKMKIEEKILLLRELYHQIEDELTIIKKERKKHALMSYRGQELSKKIPGILISLAHINRKIREINK